MAAVDTKSELMCQGSYCRRVGVDTVAKKKSSMHRCLCTIPNIYPCPASCSACMCTNVDVTVAVCARLHECVHVWCVCACRCASMYSMYVCVCSRVYLLLLLVRAEKSLYICRYLCGTCVVVKIGKHAMHTRCMCVYASVQ